MIKETTEKGMSAEERFSQLFDLNYRDVLAFALRRADCNQDAADIVSEVFSVVWRRIDDAPADPEARLWIYGIARLTLQNFRRANFRRSKLSERLTTMLDQHIVTDHAHAIAEHHAIHTAMSYLTTDEREALQLVAWEGLEPSEIAEVLQVPAATVRGRLFRARNHLRQILEAKPTEEKLIVSKRWHHNRHVESIHLALVHEEEK